jgi:LysM repeat protein
MANPTTAQVHQQYEGTRLAAAAYGAEKIKALLATNPTSEVLVNGMTQALVSQGFTVEQAGNFVRKYTPITALDQDGAGAVIFRDNDSGKVAVAIRGTDTSNSENKWNDLYLADSTIAQNHLPLYQTTLIANFVLRETTSAGEPAPQFAVQGIGSNLDDLKRAALESLASTTGGEAGSVPQMITMPRVIQTGVTYGTGRALGECADAAAHSEGSPAATTIGSALAQCSRITTVNGPGVSGAQMQSMADQITEKSGRPSVDIAKQSQLNIHTTGVSVIDDLNGGLPGASVLLNIPTALGGVVGSHSSLVAMNAAEYLYNKAAQERNQAYDAFRQGEIDSTNQMGPNGQPLGTRVEVTSAASEIWRASSVSGQWQHSIDIKNGDGSTTRIDQQIDKASGKVVQERVYENVNAGNPSGYVLTTILDHENGTQWAVNRLTGKMEYSVLAASAVTQGPGDSFQPLPNSGTEGNSYTIQSGDSLWKIGKSFGLSDGETAQFIRDTEAAARAGGSNGNVNDLKPGNTLALPEWVRGKLEQQAAAQDVTNPASANAVNGSDLQSDQYTPPKQQALSDFEQALLDAFQNPQIPDGPGTQYADAGSNTASDAGGASGTAQNSQANQPTAGSPSTAEYVNGSDLQSDLATAERMAQLQAAAALGLVNTIIGLQNWNVQSDLSHLSTAIGLYNQLNHISGGALGSSTGLGNLGQLGAGLGFLSALESGNVGGIVANGVALGNAVFDGAVSSAIGNALGIQAGNVVPGLGLLIALDSGDPLSVVSAALAFVPGWGQAAAIFLSIAGSMFESDIPMKEGLAHAEWDAQGNTQVIADQDAEGGGATATGWMNSIVAGLQAQLAATQDAAGNSYALIPNLLPAIGYQYDADGMNYGSAPGHMYLQWVDAAGNTQTRYYDGAGNRADGTGETLAGDFMAHAQGAIAPAWQVQTVLAHWQQGQGIHLPDNQAGLPQELADGIHQTLQALTLELSSPPTSTSSLIDIDADGYLERTQWVGVDQKIVAIDANGDGQIGAGELLSLGGSALNSLNWLDANNDKVLNASDPAFGALRLWMDINSDGNSSGEAQTLNQAGITAIDFGSNPPSVIRSDGSREALTAQTLTGDILGVRYTATVGGVLEAKERGETVLHAVNTRQFDGQADHMHGGDADTDGTAEGQAVLINAQDSRLSTTTARTLANRPVFVPIAATTQAQAQREVTAAMVRSAESTLLGTSSGAAPLVALALGAGAVQWPTVAAANSTSAPAEEGAASSAATALASQASGVQHATAAGNSVPPTGPASGTLATPADPMRIDLSALQTGRVIAGVQPIAGEGQTVPAFDASNQDLAQMGRAQEAIGSVASLAYSSTAADSSSDVVSGLSATLRGSAGNADCEDDIQLTYPTVMGELIAGTEDIGLRIAAALLLANDSTLNAGDPSRPILSISAVGSPSHGQVALRINEAGATEVVFIPQTNYHGPASFVYTVTDQYGLSTVATATLEIASVNDAPTPVADAANGDEDAILMFTAASLLANDFDVDSAVDGDVLRITRVGVAQHGQVFLQADGNIRFVPDRNYNGPAQFSYWVADRSEAAMAAASGGSTPGGVGLVTPGTMHLTVLPVNDLPVVTGEAIASDEDIVLTINPALLLANDSDVDTATNGQVLTISAVSGAQHGAVVLLADGTVQFTPEQDYFGPASFVYTVDDGNGGQVQSTAVVNLASVNDVPVVNDELLIGKRNATYTLSQAALLANDTDLETPGGLTIVTVQGMSHGTAVLNANGSVTFAPEPGYAGRGRFEYVVQDAEGGQAVAATEIDFATINANPITTDDSFIGFEDIAFVIQANQLLSNDADPDASGLAALTLDAVRNASHGTVHLQADGSVRFDPVANFYGTASFEYRSNDGEGGQTWATAYLNVQAVNDAPVITNIWYASGDDATIYTVSEQGDSTYTLDDLYRQNGGVVAYDPDGDSATLTVSIGGGPQHGHAWANVVVPVSAPYALNYQAAPNYFAPQAGAWQYFSHLGDPYSGSDPFTITVTDGQGASTSAMVYAAHQGSSAGGGGKCPIVMDLNGDGIELIRPEDSDIFADVNSDGWRERIGWAADEDGVLTFDANRDGRITENAEVSFVGYKEGARTDLDGLAAFDTDGDGKLSAGDAAWSQFGVLRDANGNGRQDEGELVSLDRLGVTAIGLLRQGSPRLDNGNVVFGTTDVTYADGRTGQAGDVMFAGENVPLPAAVQVALEAAAQAVLLPLSPPTEEEEVERLALLMTQYGALAEGSSEPLGFVDWTQASPTQSPAEAMASALVQTDHFGTSPAGNP